jgi:hypothetical protein
MDEACNRSVARASIHVAQAWIHAVAIVRGGREVAHSRYHSRSSRRHSGLDPCCSGLDLPLRTVAAARASIRTACH